MRKFDYIQALLEDKNLLETKFSETKETNEQSDDFIDLFHYYRELRKFKVMMIYASKHKQQIYLAKATDGEHVLWGCNLRMHPTTSLTFSSISCTPAMAILECITPEWRHKEFHRESVTAIKNELFNGHK